MFFDYTFCDLQLYYVFCFFFQAEDGIRDRNVTGVQTCALPIYFYLLRVFYAAENAMIPMVVQVGAAALSLSLAYGIAPLVPPETLAHLIALVFTVVHVFQLVLTHMLVKHFYGDYGVTAVI